MSRWNLRRRFQARVAGLWLLASLSPGPTLAQEDHELEPFGAEDYGAEDAEVRIPEPMVFDLVRGLGADRGEVEVNSLGIFPLERGRARAIDWAPEIELALFDGFAVEFELPFHGAQLDAWKLAAQGTFGTIGRRFIHGAQFIAERMRHDGAWELTALYVPGIRFDRTWSALAMVGLRTTVGAEAIEPGELLANLSVFAHLTYHSTVGLETNLASTLDGRASLLTMPQVHLELTDHFVLQVGAGARFRPGGATPAAAARAIVAF